MDDNKLPANPSDHLANERTFLAWIRTSIAIIGLGFVVVKFSFFIKQIALVLNDKDTVLPNKGYSTQIGVLLVALGVLLTVMAYIRYRVTEKQITSKSYKPSFTLLLFITLAIFVIGCLLIIYLLPGL
jgi:putative membrane protein